jgi:hypothetical protein
MSFIINFENTSSETGTVSPDGGFYYTDNLNSINRAQLIFTGSGEVKRSLIELGSQIKIYRNGTLEFHGLVDDIELYGGGAMSVSASGYEIWLAKENGAYAGSPWTSTASATIFTAVVGESTKLSAGTIEAGTSIDFRANKSDSLFNVINNLRKKTSQDLKIDYSDLTVDILDHKGSSTSVETLNAGIQIGDPRIAKGYPISNKVKVYGPGEGQTRIQSDDAEGQDATSQSTYGIITYVIEDRTITTVAEANLLANAEVARLKEPRKIYDFDVLNPAKDWESGDVLTINAPGQDVSAEEVRVVQLKRGVKNKKEFLEVEVTNKEYSELTKTRDEVIAEIDKKYRDSVSYDIYQDEYTNAHCSTCIAGNSYVCSDNCWSFAGKLWYDGSTTCLDDIFAVNYGNSYLSFNAGMTVCAPMFQVGSHAGTSSADVIFSTGLDMCSCNIYNLANPVNAQDAATKYYVDNATGGSNIWADGTDPYIVPCNSCGICMSNNIIDGTSGNCLGIPQSPGAWKEIHGACGEFTRRVAAPVVYGGSGVSICASGAKLAEFGTTCTCLATIRTKDIHAYTNGACCVGISACRFLGGYINNIYACRKLVIPVGTNCY